MASWRLAGTPDPTRLDPCFLCKRCPPDAFTDQNCAKGAAPDGKEGMMIELTSTLTCPACGYEASLRMPSDSCQFFWACPNCTKRIRPVAGDCCVFCSYGTVPCPSRQDSST